MEEQPSAGDLLQPTAAGFLGLLKVLGVLAVLVKLPAYIMELKSRHKKLTRRLRKRIIQKYFLFILMSCYYIKTTLLISCRSIV